MAVSLTARRELCMGLLKTLLKKHLWNHTKKHRPPHSMLPRGGQRRPVNLATGAGTLLRFGDDAPLLPGGNGGGGNEITLSHLNGICRHPCFASEPPRQHRGGLRRPARNVFVLSLDSLLQAIRSEASALRGLTRVTQNQKHNGQRGCFQSL